MTLIEKLSNLGGIVDRDEMAKACSEISDEDLRLALMTLALTYNQNIKMNEEISQKQSREIEQLQNQLFLVYAKFHGRIRIICFNLLDSILHLNDYLSFSKIYHFAQFQIIFFRIKRHKSITWRESKFREINMIVNFIQINPKKRMII